MEQEGWQKLINQNLPCPVLVVKQNEDKKGEIQVVFHNQNTQKEFKRVGTMDVNWIMNNIYVNTHRMIGTNSEIESFNKVPLPQTIKDILVPPIQNILNEPNSEINGQNTLVKTLQPLEESYIQNNNVQKFNQKINKQFMKSSIGANLNNYSNQQSMQNFSNALEQHKNSQEPDFITFQKFDVAGSNILKQSQQIQQQKPSQYYQQFPSSLKNVSKYKIEQTVTNNNSNPRHTKFLNMKNHLTSIIEVNKYTQTKQNKNDLNEYNLTKKYVPLKELIIKKIENYRNAKSQQSLNNLKNQNTNFLRLEKEEHFTKCILNITVESQKEKKEQSENEKQNDVNCKNGFTDLKQNFKQNKQNSHGKNCDSNGEDEDDQEYNHNNNIYNPQSNNNNSIIFNSYGRKDLKSGGIEYYEMRLVECIWENELSILILMTNISDKIKTDFYREINHYKDDLINTVTHDLKTPLNGIISILESAISLTSFNEMQKCVQIARKNGVLLTAIINDIQDFQNMKKGEFKLNPQKFNLNELMIEIRELIEYQAKSKGIEFKSSINVENTFIYNDFNRIKQIVLNLIGNALKFTFDGYISFEITQLNNTYLRFSIVDTGIGISNQLQQKIFQPYGTYQQKKNYQHGCGIGLAICQKLVQKVGNGSIELTSKEGQGSTFNFLVYRYLEDEQVNLSKYQLQESIQSPKRYKNLGEQYYKQQQLEILKKKEIMQNYSNSKSYQHLPSDALSLELLEGPLTYNNKMNMHAQSSTLKIDSEKAFKQANTEKENSNNNPNTIDSQFKQLKIDKNKNNIKISKHRSHPTIPPQLSEILPGNDLILPPNLGINGCSFINQSHSNIMKIQQSQLDIRHENSSQQLIQKPQQFEEIDFIPISSENKIDSRDKVQTPLFSKFKFINTIGVNVNKPKIVHQSTNTGNTQTSPLFTSNANITKDDSDDFTLNVINHHRQKGTQDQIQPDLKKGLKNQTSINQQSTNFSSQIMSLNNNNSSNQTNLQNMQRKKGRKVTQSVLIQNNTLGKLVFSKYKKILIVDDTGFNILALKLLLKQQISSQTEVFEAFNGRQALEIAKEKYKNQQYITLILMDVNMPIMDGIEATRIIKNLVKEGKMNPLKIVMITAFGSLKDRQTAKLAGADAYMEKPVTVNSLIAAVEQAESGQD